MNREERYIARMAFQLKIHQNDGQEYENFFIQIMTKSNPNFEAVKAYGRIGDMKNDGFDKVAGHYYQIFAPETVDKPKTINDAVKKLRNDFYGLLKHWNSLCPIKKFCYVVNDKYKGIPAPVHQEILKLQQENPGIVIENFPATKLEDIFLSLNEDIIFDIVGLIPSLEIDYLDFGVLREAIQFIMSSESEVELDKNNNLLEFEEKIEFNGLGESVGALLTTGSYQIGDLEEFFRYNSEYTRNDIKVRLKDLYEESKEVVSQDIENYGDKRFLYILEKASPNKKKAVRDAVIVLMAYYFETCDIYEKPEEVRER